MDVYGTEEEKIEAIKKWWNQNGKSIIAGIVIGITAIYGWRGYINYNISQEKVASIIYEKLLNASKVMLDCKNHQIVILEQKTDDEYSEQKKILKSLGYIK